MIHSRGCNVRSFYFLIARCPQRRKQSQIKREQTIFNTTRSAQKSTIQYPHSGAAPRRLQSFVSSDGQAPHFGCCAGNPCELIFLDGPPGDVRAAASTVTRCWCWPVPHDAGTAIAVGCYSAAGQLIQCCGHGLLAAAHSWQRQLQRDELSLLMNGSLVPSWREGEVTWLRFEGIRSRACAVPHWLPHVFHAAHLPTAAAVAGNEQGYLVLQWPDDFDLKRLAPPAVSVGKYTERALICTAARPQWGAGAVQLRYFAPQYGIAEDAATGSAMRVLAHYWSSRFSRLTAQQSSPAGGLLLSRYHSSHVEVGGCCVERESRTHG